MGRLLGGLAGYSAPELGGIAIQGALEKANLSPTEVEYVLMGQVLTAGNGQLPARQAAALGGIPMSVPATTVSKVCLSGIQSVILADQFIRTGDTSILVAGGQESMSNTPHLLHVRKGHKYGDVTMADHMALDGLQDAFTSEAMGLLTERRNDSQFVSRAEQDAFAAESHRRAARAWDSGYFDEEVIRLKDKRSSTLIERDEAIRPNTTSDVLGKLPSAFREGGTVTAGNASGISDGACALIIMDKELAEARGIRWLAEIGSHAMVAGPDTSLHHQPAEAIKAACARENISPQELDLVEINEAFAAVGVASTRLLGVSPEIVNVNGGAIALGHPLGMSGARLVLHLALELKRRGGGIGAAGLCGGGGQGDALILRVPKA